MSVEIWRLIKERKGIGRVDLADGPLGGTGIFVLSDAAEVALVIAHDAPVSVGIGKIGRAHV